MTRICAGIITWQDGPALDNCLQSIRGVVDELIIVDGLIDGVQADGLPPLTDQDRLWKLVEVHGGSFEQARWRSQSAQRNVTLRYAKQRECDWLLAIDADEQLCNGHNLKPWLDVWGWDAFPLPFYFNDVQEACPAGFKLLHVPFWTRYACQGSMLENTAGEVVQVIGQTWWSRAKEMRMPYLVHRPELRSPERQSIRLSELECALEPVPDNVKAWREPVYAPRLIAGEGLLSQDQAALLGLPVWYCPGCDRRYAGPGMCRFEHAPIGLEPLEVAA